MLLCKRPKFQLRRAENAAEGLVDSRSCAALRTTCILNVHQPGADCRSREQKFWQLVLTMVLFQYSHAET